MSTQTTTYTTPGESTYTAPSTLLGGAVTVTVDGSEGDPGPPQDYFQDSVGRGGQVSATVLVSPGDVLDCYVGDYGSNGYHPGGGGYAGSYSTGSHGGGSSAVVISGTVLLEGGGGGGSSGNQGGNGGISPQSGAAAAGPGNGDYGGDGGGGGHQGAGGAGLTGTSAAGGVAPGGGGVSGGTQYGAGAGAGGLSYAASSGVSNVVFTDGANASTGSVQIVATVADPPLVPTLTSPTNGAYLDAAAAGLTFQWTYNPGTDSGAQSGYALRISTDGGAYQYWNATSAALQASEVWNSSAAAQAVIPAGVLADGHSYTWSVATEESHYGLQGPFASDAQFNATAMPTVTVNAPAGSASSATPTVAWSDTLGSGDTQTSFRVVVYTKAVTGQSGFAPGSTTPTADSGVISTAATTWAVSAPLAQGDWVVYVQVTETGGVASAWTSSAFTVAYDPPAEPTLPADAALSSQGVPQVTLTVVAHDNLLSADDASFEGSIGTWTPGAGCTLAQSTAEALDGSHSLAVTASSSGGPFTLAPSSTGGYGVTGGITKTAIVSLRAAATGRQWTVGIEWKDAGGTVLSTSTGTAVTDTTTGWTEATVTAVAPSNAAKADLVLTGTAVADSEVHYVDCAGLYTASTAPAWSRGGLVGIEQATIQRSLDGGSTWTTVRGTPLAVPANTEQVTVVDSEAPFDTAVEYQATISAQVTTPVAGTITSPAATAEVTTPAAQWALTDPLDPTTVLLLHRLGQIATMTTTLQAPISFSTDQEEQIGVFYGFGNPDPIVQHGTLQDPTFTLSALLEGRTEYDTFQALRARQRTLQLRSDMGDSWYVALGPSVSLSLIRAADRVTNPLWILSVPCTVTAAP